MLSSRHRDRSGQLWLLLLLSMLATLSLCLACRVSEFSCKGSGSIGSICVPLDKYCDGRSDCADGSDEPKHCSGEYLSHLPLHALRNVSDTVYLLSLSWTVCNRTYYGDIGRTYAIKVPTPQWNKLPFLCHLTFTASGHDQGDIVQVSHGQVWWNKKGGVLTVTGYRCRCRCRCH